MYKFFFKFKLMLKNISLIFPVYVNVNYCYNYLKIAAILLCFYYILINNCRNFLIKNSHLRELGIFILEF